MADTVVHQPTIGTNTPIAQYLARAFKRDVGELPTLYGGRRGERIDVYLLMESQSLQGRIWKCSAEGTTTAREVLTCCGHLCGRARSFYIDGGDGKISASSPNDLLLMVDQEGGQWVFELATLFSYRRMAVNRTGGCIEGIPCTSIFGEENFPLVRQAGDAVQPADDAIPVCMGIILDEIMEKKNLDIGTLSASLMCRPQGKHEGSRTP